MGLVTVSVTVGGAVAPDIAVVFHAPDGSVLAQASTDAAGAASFASEPALGMVTAFGPIGTAAEQLTIAGVQPGDVLVIALLADTAPVASENVSVSPLVGASDYAVSVGCMTSSGSTTLPITLDARCIQGDTFDAFAVASHNAGGATTLDGWAVAKGLPVIDGGSPVLGTWNAFAARGLALTSVPTGVASVVLESYLALDAVTKFGGERATLTVNGGSANSTLHLPGTLADVDARLSFAMPGTTATTAHVMARAPAAGFPATVSLDPAGLPTINGVAMDVTDPTRPSVSWTANGNASASDGNYVSTTWTAQGIGYRWTLLTAPDALSVRYPALPSSLAGRAPAAATLAIGEVAAIDVDAIAGPAAFRSNGAAWVENSIGDLPPPSAAFIVRRISATPP